MAMTIFFILNGVGVIFLLYVLANFWKEGHRPKSARRQYETDFIRKDKPEVLVVTYTISNSAQGGLSVIGWHARERSLRGKQAHRGPAGKTVEMPLERFSAR